APLCAGSAVAGAWRAPCSGRLLCGPSPGGPTTGWRPTVTASVATAPVPSSRGLEAGARQDSLVQHARVAGAGQQPLDGPRREPTKRRWRRLVFVRSEERRVGKEGGRGWSGNDWSRKRRALQSVSGGVV